MGIAGYNQAWWSSPFARAFVPDEWHRALQDHFRQRKQNQKAEAGRLMENSDHGSATSKGGAGHSLYAKRNGTTSHTTWSEPIINKSVKQREREKRLTSDERLLAASSDGNAPPGDKGCDSPPPKKKRKRGRPKQTVRREPESEGSARAPGKCPS